MAVKRSSCCCSIDIEIRGHLRLRWRWPRSAVERWRSDRRLVHSSRRWWQLSSVNIRRHHDRRALVQLRRAHHRHPGYSDYRRLLMWNLDSRFPWIHCRPQRTYRRRRCRPLQLNSARKSYSSHVFCAVSWSYNKWQFTWRWEIKTCMCLHIILLRKFGKCSFNLELKLLRILPVFLRYCSVAFIQTKQFI